MFLTTWQNETPCKEAELGCEQERVSSLMKLLSRELGQKERRDVCKILENFAASLRSIHSQAIFKRVALLGGVEKTLKAMREREKNEEVEAWLGRVLNYIHLRVETELMKMMTKGFCNN